MSRSLEKKRLNVPAKLAIRGLLLALASFVLISCHASSHPKGVVGKWEGNLSGHRAACTYRKDGSFNRTVEAGIISLEFDGSYELKGDIITERIKTARIGGRPSLSPSINSMLNKPIETHFQFDGGNKLVISDDKGNKVILFRK